MIQVLPVDAATREQYSHYVAAHPQARFGHDLAWAEVLRDTYGVESEHLIALEDGKVVGICPLFLCRPLLGGAHYQTSLFPSYFGPLYDSERALNEILDALMKKTSALQYAEILSPVSLPADERLPYFETLDYTYRLPLNDSPEKIFSNFRRNYRRILKDRRFYDEVELIVDTKGELTRQFYRLYAGLYARKHGFIPHIEKLFHNIFAYYPNGAARIYMARSHGKYIAGIFTFWAHGEAYCGWSALDLKTEYLPMHFLIWKIIQDGLGENYRWFNHGEAPAGHESLKLFKQGWNMAPAETFRYFMPGRLTKPNVRLYDRFSWTKRLVSALPSRVTSAFLSPLIRYVL